MHELSIAQNLIEIASEAAQKAGATRVRELRLRLGALAGVSVESLLFCYDIAAQGTLLEGSRLCIDEAPVVIFCADCKAEHDLPAIVDMCCPVCGATRVQVRSGRQMELSAIEVDVPELQGAPA
jgi:hydrogenase nickel incorporation protein HypA/HybF